MKKLLKKPEILLVAMALILFACALYIGYFPKATPEGSKVIYVSAKDKENLLSDGTAESVIINLNTASKEELCLLKGVDTILAQAIIDYRTENSGFEDVEELLNIKGIGEIKYKNIIPYVTLE